MTTDKSTCLTCMYWVKEYGACFNGRSTFCTEYTKPDHTCPSWGKKIPKTRERKYERRVPTKDV